VNGLREFAIFPKNGLLGSACPPPVEGKSLIQLAWRRLEAPRPRNFFEERGMRAIPTLALAMLTLGIGSAAAETKYSESVVGEHLVPSSLERNVTIGASYGELVVSPAAESSDAPHDQGEQRSEPAHTSQPAEVSAEENAARSLNDVCNALFTSAKSNDLPVPFFANLIWHESGLRFDAVSPVGAQGIAQFMPKVAAEVGLRDPFDPRQAIPASARFLKALREQFNNLGFVAAAYNAGAHRVAEWLEHGLQLPRETRNYVEHVTGRSVEAWRKSPTDGSHLAFARPLPCRKLPAFADLEQAQLQDTRASQAQLEVPLEAVAAKDMQKATATKLAEGTVQKGVKTGQEKAVQVAVVRPAGHPAQRPTGTGRPKIAQQEQRKISPREAATERKVARATDSGKTANTIARNSHVGKREPLPHQHAVREKRRLT
jgi:Transglycosylase SLT domain